MKIADKSFMTKRTLIAGFAILLFLSLIVGVGIFLSLRFNGLAAAEATIQKDMAQIDGIVLAQKETAEKLLTETKALSENEAYKDLEWDDVSFLKNQKKFQDDDESFQEVLEDFLDVVSADEAVSSSETVGSLVGELQAAQLTLRKAKIDYNDRVDEYEDKKDSAPGFVADLLSFPEYKKFTNISKPLDTQNGEDEENVVPDINSFN